MGDTLPFHGLKRFIRFGGNDKRGSLVVRAQLSPAGVHHVVQTGFKIQTRGEELCSFTLSLPKT